MTKETPTEFLSRLLDYSPWTGRLYWKTRTPDMFKNPAYCERWNAQYAGKEAFTATNAAGYKVGNIFCILYYAHRVAWALHTGKWPVNEIDHIDCDKGNNRFANLREAGHQQNSCNVLVVERDKSKFKGVHPRRVGRFSRLRWVATIKVNGRKVHLGTFATETEAAEAYNAAAVMHFGSYAKLNSL